ncbi:MAG: hypothetical protein ACYDC8_15535 [Gammaproteobacteria bacterium]
MNKVIIADLCRTHDEKPLATVVSGFPGDGADLTPEQLRSLAATLLRIADDTEAQTMGRRGYRRQRREYSLVT